MTKLIRLIRLMLEAGGKLLSANPFDMRDAFVFGGIGSVAYGVAQIFPPAAFIVGGVALFWLGVKR